MKKQYALSLGQLIFLILSMSIIAILAFLLGIEVGKFLQSSEGNLKTPGSALKPSVTISLENYSSVIREQYKNESERPVQQKENEKPEEKPGNAEKTKSSVLEKSAESILIQVGAYKEKTSYLATEKRLNALGFKTKIVEGKLTKLMVIVDDKGKVDEVLKRLEKEGIKGIVVKK